MKYKTVNAVCIGGPKDGVTYTVDSSCRYITLPEYPKLYRLDGISTWHPDDTLNEYRYYLEGIPGKSDLHYILRFQDYTMDDVLSEVLVKYESS